MAILTPARLSLALLALGGPARAASAQTVIVDLDTPDLDRWNYPFNSTPGFDDEIPTFGALGVDFFDDRESQVLIGFNTGGAVQTGLGPNSYQIQSARLTLTVADGAFLYDPTSDAFETYLPDTDPSFQMDPDPGRPVELFGAAFRGGFTAATYMEDSPFAPESQPPFTRNAFATDFDNQIARDVSNNVREGFEVAPFAVGMNPGATPGAFFPLNSDMAFDINLANPDVERFMQEALDSGLLRLMVTSLHEAQQPAGTGGDAPEGTGPMYPIFFSKESKFAGLGFAARLDMEVTIVQTDPADLNGDGKVDGADLGLLLQAWDPVGPTTSDADLNGDGTVDGADLGLLLQAWSP